MIPLPDLRKLTETKKNALILPLWAQVQSLATRPVELEAWLNQPPKTPGHARAAWPGRATATRPG